jgi:hypothetical protein
VVWVYKRWTFDRTVQALRIDGSGGPVGTVLTVAPSQDWGTEEAVVDSGAGVSMVVWMAAYNPGGAPFGKQVVARVVRPDGTMTASRAVATSNYFAERQGFDVSFGAGRFLVAWRIGDRVGPKMLEGRYLGADGSLLTDRIDLADRTGAEQYPQVASDGTNFLCVLQDPGDLVGQFVDTTGTLLFTESTEGFSVSNAGGDQTQNTLEFVDGAFTTVFQDDRWGTMGLYMQRIDTVNRIFGSESFANVPLYVGSADAGPPDMATDGTHGFATWVMEGDVYVDRTLP